MEKSFQVEMWAFMNGKVREVRVPDHREGEPLGVILEKIFFWGQNDHQPNPELPSLSIGDVILYGGQKYLILHRGCAELTSIGYERIKNLDPLQRLLYPVLADRVLDQIPQHMDPPPPSGKREIH